MAKSSINFAKAKSHSEDHNLRKDEPSYLLPKEHRLKNEFWQHEKKETELFSESASKQKTGRKPKFENSRWEAIVNFNKSHTLGDLQKVATHIENKFNVTCSSIAMHKDEGHINERGIVEYNLHAHVNFITHKDGKQNWRKEFVKPKDLRELQTEVAELMGMERGTDKRISKTQRLEHTQFKQQVQGLAKQKDLKAEIAELRSDLKAMGAKREQYAVLEGLNRDLKAQIKAKNISKFDLENKLKEYANINTKQKKLINALEAKISLKASESTAISPKNDLKAISSTLNDNFREQLETNYKIEQLERYGAGSSVAFKWRFEDKAKFEIEKIKVDFFHHTRKEVIKIDREDYEAFKKEILEIEKSLIQKISRFQKAVNFYQSLILKVKDFISPKKEFQRVQKKERVINRQKSSGIEI